MSLNHGQIEKDPQRITKFNPLLTNIIGKK